MGHAGTAAWMSCAETRTLCVKKGQRAAQTLYQGQALFAMFLRGVHNVEVLLGFDRARVQQISTMLLQSDAL